MMAANLHQPQLAIRAQCRECMGGDYALIRECPSDGREGRHKCALWEFRLSRGNNAQGKSRLKAIRAFCLDCCGGHGAEVRDCGEKACSMHRFRMGNNPALKGTRRWNGFLPPSAARGAEADPEATETGEPRSEHGEVESCGVLAGLPQKPLPKS